MHTEGTVTKVRPLRVGLEGSNRGSLRGKRMTWKSDDSQWDP